MNAVERLQAAIEKLERLRNERGYIEHSGWLVEENPNDRGGFLEPPEPFIPITNDEIIVTLHRTIDAQLTILYRGLTSVAPEREVAEMLADAILGEAS
ncbi:hypothetical protein J2X63_003218 [Agromyces sp. 3263]|uniref:hypothetical protein n=1 Tax=Agromyces sp. 3263 TaxID=2817750 RepID=UPI002863C809|nr:hypothetical protein [Agromyces sp. 3263]MDR6907510.1 hypothetical protein [Agromyces sp. 3263]